LRGTTQAQGGIRGHDNFEPRRQHIMSNTDNREEFSTLMKRVREGSHGADRELLERYGPHIRKVIRRKLHRKLRNAFDSSDFEQAVWASFFTTRLRQYTFDRAEALIRFLSRIAENKVIEIYRQRFRCSKYDLNREQRLESTTAEQQPGRDPTPSQ